VSENNETADMSFGRGDNASKGPIIPKSANEALRPEQVPRPPRRSRKARSQLVIFLNFLMTVIVFVTIAAGAIFYYALDSFEKPGPLAANTNFIVRNGAGVNEIASSLERNDIITDSRVFRGMSRIYLKDAVLKAGEYEIRAGASMHDILELLQSGKSILYSVSVPEGLTVKQVFQRLTDDAGGAEGAGAADLGEARRRPSDRLAGGTGDACLDRGKGDGQGRRASARGIRLHQQAREEDAPAVRPDDHLRHLRW